MFVKFKFIELLKQLKNEDNPNNEDDLKNEDYPK